MPVPPPETTAILFSKLSIGPPLSSKRSFSTTVLFQLPFFCYNRSFSITVFSATDLFQLLTFLASVLIELPALL